MWTVPAEHTKDKRAHRIPLSGRAREILEIARGLPDRSGLVFPSRGGTALSDAAFSKLVRRLGIPAVPHGFPFFLPRLVWRDRGTTRSRGSVSGSFARSGGRRVRAVGPLRAKASAHGVLVRLPRRLMVRPSVEPGSPHGGRAGEAVDATQARSPMRKARCRRWRSDRVSPQAPRRPGCRFRCRRRRCARGIARRARVRSAARRAR